jgi:hypothetical protein
MLRPPNTNGIMELTKAEETDIRAKLEAIQTDFVGTDEQPMCDTFYITSSYNKENVGNEINGDTVQFLLQPIVEEVI